MSVLIRPNIMAVTRMELSSGQKGKKHVRNSCMYVGVFAVSPSRELLPQAICTYTFRSPPILREKDKGGLRSTHQ